MKTSYSFALSTAVFTFIFVGKAKSFWVQPLTSSTTVSRQTCLSASTRRRNKKESMAEKRARRKARQQREISQPKRSNKVTLVEENVSSAQETAEAAAVAAAAAAKTSSSGGTTTTMTKAQDLIEKQRRSVSMLTLVKESIENISAEEATRALNDQGYYVVDNFLGDETTLQELQDEAVKMLDNGMTPDVENLASGEYVGPVKGGEDQYLICPRSIEWVVGTTKHFGSMVVPDMNLDSGNCLGRMRTFDRQAFQAAKILLTDDEAAVEADLEKSKGRFACLVNAADITDQRRLSIRYYLVAADWDFGGGIEFESQGVMEAKRDRLVLWKSAETAMRAQPWRGDEMHRFGSCLELDLIQTSQ